MEINRATVPNTNLIEVGQKLVLPRSGSSNARMGFAIPLSPPRAPRVYVVKPGDTLASIAARELGHYSRWPEIAEINRATVPNTNLIEVGQKLVLPRSGSSNARMGLSAPPAKQTVGVGHNESILVHCWDRRAEEASKRS